MRSTLWPIAGAGLHVTGLALHLPLQLQYFGSFNCFFARMRAHL